MPKIIYSVTINQPIGKVFRFATDFKRIAQWQTDTKDFHCSENKPRVGIFITHTRSTRLLRWKLDLNADITDYRTNKMLEYKGALGHFHAHDLLEFSSKGRSTIITETINIRMGFLNSIFVPLMKRVMQKRTKKALNKLKELLEAGAPTAPVDDDNE
jgi:uncharacterized membrane protein